jgi:hypothetical protein
MLLMLLMRLLRLLRLPVGGQRRTTRRRVNRWRHAGNLRCRGIGGNRRGVRSRLRIVVVLGRSRVVLGLIVLRGALRRRRLERGDLRRGFERRDLWRRLERIDPSGGLVRRNWRSWFVGGRRCGALVGPGFEGVDLRCGLEWRDAGTRFEGGYFGVGLER